MASLDRTDLINPITETTEIKMQDFQQRVVEEKRELDEKLQKLEPFTITETYKALPKDEQARLVRQCYAMKDYSDVLGERIAAFQ